MAAFGSGGLRGRRRANDQARARALKDAKVERTGGRCVVCFQLVHGNDTFGGVDVLNHYARHARGYEDRRR